MYLFYFIALHQWNIDPNSISLFPDLNVYVSNDMRHRYYLSWEWVFLLSCLTGKISSEIVTYTNVGIVCKSDIVKVSD